MAKKKAVSNGNDVEEQANGDASADVAPEAVPESAPVVESAPAVEPPKPDNWISLSGFVNPS